MGSMSENLSITVTLPVPDLAEAVAGQNKPHEIVDLVDKVVNLAGDEHVTWLIISKCLETLTTMYTEEAEWYSERELTETFVNGRSETGYSANREEALAYLGATQSLYADCRRIMAGKPEDVVG